MTFESWINAALEARYLGKRIAGPDYDPVPFIVTGVVFDVDYDYVSVRFGSDEPDPRDPSYKRGFNVSIYDEMPEVLP